MCVYVKGGVVERGKSEVRKGRGVKGRRERGMQTCSCIIITVLLAAWLSGLPA